MKSKKPNALFADINIHFLTFFSVQFSGMFVTVITYPFSVPVLQYILFESFSTNQDKCFHTQ